MRNHNPTFREYDKDVILRWFEYRMSPEDRRALMREHPEAYNRWMGHTVAVVTIGTHEEPA